MTQVRIVDYVGDFGEDKDAAAYLRKEKISKCLNSSEPVVLDFERVTLATQSFIHALISAVLREHGEQALALLDFRNCNESIRGIISTVVQYSLDSLDLE